MRQGGQTWRGCGPGAGCRFSPDRSYRIAADDPTDGESVGLSAEYPAVSRLYILSPPLLDEADQTDQSQTYRDRVLTARRLRSLLKGQRGTTLPSDLSAYILHRLPEIFGPDAVEIVAIMREPAEAIAALHEGEGIDLSFEESGQEPPRLSSRERTSLADLSALYTWLSNAALIAVHDVGHAGGMAEEMRERSHAWSLQSIDLARLASDRRQEGVALVNRAEIVVPTTTDPTEILALVQKGEEILAEEIGPEEKEGRELLLWIRVRMALRLFSDEDHERAAEEMSAIERTLDEESSSSADRIRSIVHRTRSHLAVRRMEYTEALTEARRSVQLSSPEIDPVPHCQLLQTLGSLYVHMEHRDQGLRYYLDAIEILEENRLASEGFWVYFSAAAVYVDLGDAEAAHAILDRLAEQLGFDGNEAPEEMTLLSVSFRTARARALLGEGESDRALKILDRTIDEFGALGIPYNEAVAAHLAAKGESQRGDHQAAARYLERAVAVSQQSSKAHRLRYRLALARRLVLTDRLDEATTLLDDLESTIGTEGRPYIELLRARSALCEKGGDYPQALAFEREAVEREQEFIAIDRERSVRFGRIVAEIHLLEGAIEKERDQRQRLEHALASAVVELGAKKEVIERVTEELRREASGGRADDEGINASRFFRILASLRPENESTSPLAFLGPAADEFIVRLRAAHPHLTTSQQRFCALLRFGLSASEICSILDIGPEGLKSRRKRLRKGLGVKKGESLEGVIGGI